MIKEREFFWGKEFIFNTRHLKHIKIYRILEKLLRNEYEKYELSSTEIIIPVSNEVDYGEVKFG